MDLAREFLRSLALDEDLHAYLRIALDDFLDLDEDELRSFLDPFLAANAVDKMIQLLSGSAAGCTGNVKAEQQIGSVVAGVSQIVRGPLDTTEPRLEAETCEVDNFGTAEISSVTSAVDEISKLEMQDSSMCSAKEGIAEKKSTQRASHTKRTSTARRTSQAKASQFDKRNGTDGADFCDSDTFECDVAETGVLKARCIKTGHHVMINNRPCRVEKVGTSKVWKGPLTGCFKSHVVARCIFTGKKYEHLCPAAEDVSVAAVQKLECTVMDIGDDGELSLLTSTLDTKADVNLPCETDDDWKLSERIKADFQKGKTIVILVVCSCGIEKVVEIVRHKCTD